MALNAYPFESANTTEDQYTKLFRNFAGTGIVGTYGDTSFAVTSDGSGLDLQVAQGYAIIRGHAVENDGPVTVNFDTADAQFPRIDRLVLRLNPDADGIVLHVIKGTPNANPTPAPLVQTDVDIYDLPLALVRVPALALNLTNAEITSERRWGSGRVGVWTTTTRPETPRTGTSFGYNVTTLAYEFWDGSVWKSFGGDKKKVLVPHTFTLAGPISLPNAQGDYFIPGFFLPVPAGQRVRIVGFRSVVHHGASNASFTFDIKHNAFAEPLSSGTAARTAGTSGYTSGYFANNDMVSLVVTGIVGDPRNASVTVFVEYEV